MDRIVFALLGFVFTSIGVLIGLILGRMLNF